MSLTSATTGGSAPTFSKRTLKSELVANPFPKEIKFLSFTKERSISFAGICTKSLGAADKGYPQKAAIPPCAAEERLVRLSQ